VEKVQTAYALLQPDIHVKSIEYFLQEAKSNGISKMYVPPYWVKKVVRDANNTNVKISCVTGYPFGYQLTETKLFEAEQAIKYGAEHIVLTINISAVKSEAFEWIKIEIARFAKWLHDNGKMLGVYLPSTYLTMQEIEKLCALCLSAGADDLIVPFAPYKIEGIEVVKNIMGENLGINIWFKGSDEKIDIELASLGIEEIILDRS